MSHNIPIIYYVKNGLVDKKDVHMLFSTQTNQIQRTGKINMKTNIYGMVKLILQ